MRNGHAVLRVFGAKSLEHLRRLNAKIMSYEDITTLLDKAKVENTDLHYSHSMNWRKLEITQNESKAASEEVTYIALEVASYNA